MGKKIKNLFINLKKIYFDYIKLNKVQKIILTKKLKIFNLLLNCLLNYVVFCLKVLIKAFNFIINFFLNFFKIIYYFFKFFLFSCIFNKKIFFVYFVFFLGFIILFSLVLRSFKFFFFSDLKILLVLVFLIKIFIISYLLIMLYISFIYLFGNYLRTIDLIAPIKLYLEEREERYNDHQNIAKDDYDPDMLINFIHFSKRWRLRIRYYFSVYLIEKLIKIKSIFVLFKETYLLVCLFFKTLFPYFSYVVGLVIENNVRNLFLLKLKILTKINNYVLFFCFLIFKILIYLIKVLKIKKKFGYYFIIILYFIFLILSFRLLEVYWFIGYIYCSFKFYLLPEITNIYKVLISCILFPFDLLKLYVKVMGFCFIKNFKINKYLISLFRFFYLTLCWFIVVSVIYFYYKYVYIFSFTHYFFFKFFFFNLVIFFFFRTFILLVYDLVMLMLISKILKIFFNPVYNFSWSGFLFIRKLIFSVGFYYQPKLVKILNIFLRFYYTIIYLIFFIFCLIIFSFFISFFICQLSYFLEGFSWLLPDGYFLQDFVILVDSNVGVFSIGFCVLFIFVCCVVDEEMFFSLGDSRDYFVNNVKFQNFKEFYNTDTVYNYTMQKCDYEQNDFHLNENVWLSTMLYTESDNGFAGLNELKMLYLGFFLKIKNLYFVYKKSFLIVRQVNFLNLLEFFDSLYSDLLFKKLNNMNKYNTVLSFCYYFFKFDCYFDNKKNLLQKKYYTIQHSKLQWQDSIFYTQLLHYYNVNNRNISTLKFFYFCLSLKQNNIFLFSLLKTKKLKNTRISQYYIQINKFHLNYNLILLYSVLLNTLVFLQRYQVVVNVGVGELAQDYRLDLFVNLIKLTQFRITLFKNYERNLVRYELFRFWLCPEEEEGGGWNLLEKLMPAELFFLPIRAGFFKYNTFSCSFKKFTNNTLHSIETFNIYLDYSKLKYLNTFFKLNSFYNKLFCKVISNIRQHLLLSIVNKKKIVMFLEPFFVVKDYAKLYFFFLCPESVVYIVNNNRELFNFILLFLSFLCFLLLSLQYLYVLHNHVDFQYRVILTSPFVPSNWSVWLLFKQLNINLVFKYYRVYNFWFYKVNCLGVKYGYPLYDY